MADTKGGNLSIQLGCQLSGEIARPTGADDPKQPTAAIKSDDWCAVKADFPPIPFGRRDV